MDQELLQLLGVLENMKKFQELVFQVDRTLREKVDLLIQ